MRLIDADALIKTIRENDYLVVDYFNSRDRGMFTSGILQAIDEQPSAQPEPQKWIDHNYYLECPSCKRYVTNRTPYCPYCGGRNE